MKALAALLAPALLAACAVVPTPDSTPPAPQGSAVALGQSVVVSDVTVTPTSVVEDSRCPINARCVWAGRLVVRTRWQIADWHEVIEMELGKNYDRHGRGLVLASAEPGKRADQETPPDGYRFTFGRAWYVGTDTGPSLEKK